MNILDKIRDMSPLQRHFVSAGFGVAGFGAVVLAGMPGLGLAVSLGGSFLVASYSDPTSGRIGPFGADNLKNLASFFGGYLGAPYLLGAFMGAAHAQEIDANMIQEPAPIVEQLDAQPAQDSQLDLSGDVPVFKIAP